MSRDLYCLDCGYNLRGLGGDPVCCPECGADNARADLNLPAELVSNQLRRMEVGPGLSVAMVFALTCWLLPVLWVALRPPMTPPPKYILVIIIAMNAAAVGLWFLGAVLFRGTCRARPGWIAALLWFHLYGLGLVAVCLLAFASALWSGAYLPAPRWLGFGFMPEWLWRLTLPAVGIGLALATARPLYRRAQKSIRPMQRAVAAAVVQAHKAAAVAEKEVG